MTISSIKEALAAGQWQPIETAPKDGTPFLGFEIGSYFNCWWHDNGYGEQYWMDEADSDPTPTHWMSLPPPPALSAALHPHQEGEKESSETPPPQTQAAVVSVKTMRLSDGRADYFVSIKVGDREVHPHVFRQEFKAAYHVALYDWLLNGGTEPELMAFDEGDWPAQTTELVGVDPAKLEVLEEEIGRLEDQLEEARNVPWPEWTNRILKTVRSYSGYDGYDDATEGVDLPSEVDEALSEIYYENERLRAALAASPQPVDGEPVNYGDCGENG